MQMLSPNFIGPNFLSCCLLMISKFAISFGWIKHLFCLNRWTKESLTMKPGGIQTRATTLDHLSSDLTTMQFENLPIEQRHCGEPSRSEPACLRFVTAMRVDSCVCKFYFFAGQKSGKSTR